VFEPKVGQKFFKNLTYQNSLWIRIPLEKLTVSRLVRKVPSF